MPPDGTKIATIKIYCFEIPMLNAVSKPLPGRRVAN
jgi:hypothetical protein